ncbi:MAG TPA: pyridoxamine 5'-phosphate oxidase family protein [Kofleriaceae bacterium]|jgi:general stress protein 26|nr:pyridoxamine 5'-phosphate oxidase family protein [Kofleriaceae bacterium]
MTRRELVMFLRRYKLAVQATVAGSGGPQAAVVGFAVSDELEIVFDTVTTSRKIANLRRDPRCALVIGWDDEITAQIEGTADEPTGDERTRLQQVYFAAYPDGVARASWPNVTYVRVRPQWIRYCDFRKPETIELAARELV